MAGEAGNEPALPRSMGNRQAALASLSSVPGIVFTM